MQKAGVLQQEATAMKISIAIRDDGALEYDDARPSSYASTTKKSFVCAIPKGDAFEYKSRAFEPEQIRPRHVARRIVAVEGRYFIRSDEVQFHRGEVEVMLE